MAKWWQYQAITTIAKKVGGPVALGALTFVAGVGVGNADRIAKKVRELHVSKESTDSNENTFVQILSKGEKFSSDINIVINTLTLLANTTYLVLNKLEDGYLIVDSSNDNNIPFILPLPIFNANWKHFKKYDNNE